jgi:MFS superfamily sulfate permease-like transporter
VALVTLIGMAFDGIPRVEIQPLGEALGSQFAALSNLGLGFFTLPIIGAGVGLGLVGSAESLLTARAIEGMAAGKGRKIETNLNRELLAQGAGNALCGALGALPITGVIVRSAANIESGGQTRWSTILHGVWIGVFVLALPKILALIPLTVLATVLILTGWKLLNLAEVIKGVRARSIDTAFWFLTVVAIMTTDLLKGLVIALVVYTGYHFYSVRLTKSVTGSENEAA